jgi:hypothetical protein
MFTSYGPGAVCFGMRNVTAKRPVLVRDMAMSLGRPRSVPVRLAESGEPVQCTRNVELVPLATNLGVADAVAADAEVGIKIAAAEAPNEMVTTDARRKPRIATPTLAANTAPHQVSSETRAGPPGRKAIDRVAGSSRRA